MNKQKNRTALTNSQDKSVTNFISNLNVILNAVYQKNKKDDDMNSLRDKFNVVRKENPNGLVEMAGPSIWKYREKIKDENVNFFLNNSFEEDIKEAQEKASVAEISEFEDVPVLLNKAKRAWHSFTLIEQQTIIKTIKTILQSYATYLSTCKELAAIE